MKTTFTITLTESQAEKLAKYLELKPGVPAEAQIEAWVADQLDLIELKNK
jgi:hypothetical protein